MRKILRSFPPLLMLVRALRKYKRQRKTLRQAAEYASVSPRLLQIGCMGHILQGWFNVDYFPHHDAANYMDATQPFPFPDNFFNCIFSEHMIEHIGYHEGLFMLQECYRVLKPGGRIRIATPDLKIAAALYNQPLTGEQQDYIDNVMKIWHPDKPFPAVCHVVNNIFEFQHRYVYDEFILTDSMQRAGFTGIKRFASGESDDQRFKNIDLHATDYIKFITLVLEGNKPG